MRILVTGADGQLGRALREVVGGGRSGASGVSGVSGAEWVFASRGELDIVSASGVDAFLDRTRPAAVINCAAFTDVDGAERDPEAAFAVNSSAVGVLARACVRVGAALVHVSTDYVFGGRQESANAGGKLGDETIRRLDNEAIRQLDDGLTRHRSCAAPELRGVNVGSPHPPEGGADGLQTQAEKPAALPHDRLITHDSSLITDLRPYTETDPPAPINVYGRSKLAGERAFFESGVRGAVVRTSWLWSAGGGFVAAILRNAAAQSEIKVVADQVGTPTEARSLAAALVRLISVFCEDRQSDAPAGGGLTSIPPLASDFSGADLFHFSDGPVMSRAEWAEKIIAEAGLDCRVVPVSSEEFDRVRPSATTTSTPLARRPRYSALDATKFMRVFFGSHHHPQSPNTKRAPEKIEGNFGA